MARFDRPRSPGHESEISGDTAPGRAAAVARKPCAGYDRTGKSASAKADVAADTWGRRRFPDAREIQGWFASAPAGRCLCAAGGLRQRRQSVAGARPQAQTTDGDTSNAWRIPQPSGSEGAHRKPWAGCDRRRCWDCRRLRGSRPDSAPCFQPAGHMGPRGCHSFQPRVALRAGNFGDHWTRSSVLRRHG